MAFSHVFEQRPFKNADDSTLGIVLTYSLMLFFLAALMIKSDVSSDATDDQFMFGVFLVVVLAGGPISIFIQVLFAVLKETGYTARRNARIAKRKAEKKAKMMEARKQKNREKARKAAIARGEVGGPFVPLLLFYASLFLNTPWSCTVLTLSFFISFFLVRPWGGARTLMRTSSPACPQLCGPSVKCSWRTSGSPRPGPRSKR